MESEWIPLGVISEEETENMEVQASLQRPLELQEPGPEGGGQPPDSGSPCWRQEGSWWRASQGRSPGTGPAGPGGKCQETPCAGATS